MAQERLSMRKIRELLRLKFDLGLSIHKIPLSRANAAIEISPLSIRRTNASRRSSEYRAILSHFSPRDSESSRGDNYPDSGGQSSTPIQTTASTALNLAIMTPIAGITLR